MNMKSNNSLLPAIALVVLGLATLVAGPGWLLVLVPAAVAVWFSASRPLSQHH